MMSLFKVKAITMDNKKILLKEEFGQEIEIAFAGGAFRKTFTALVLLYVLVEAKEWTKLFLMEEPELQLHPRIHQEFMTLILQVTQNFKIQLIVTTNSHLTMDLFKPRVQLCFHFFIHRIHMLSMLDE